MREPAADNYLWRFDWREDFAVGDDVVDAQHRAFFEEVGVLRTALLAHEPKNIFLKYCDDFAANLRRHFLDEEDLMARIGFPRLSEHALEHRLLLSRVEEVRQEVVEASCLLDCVLSTRNLMVMLLEHLMHEDMRLKPFLKGESKASA